VDLNFVLFFYDCDDTSEYDAFALYAMGTPDVLDAGRYNQAGAVCPVLTSSFFRRGARHVMSTSAQIFYCYHVTYTLLSSTSKKKE